MKLPKLPTRSPDSHKGNFGRILIIGGSFAMPGAVALAGQAAFRAGAGLVKAAVPHSSLPAVAAHCPCYTFLPCPATPEGTLAPEAVPLILEEAANSNVVALGCGISTHPETRKAVLPLFRGIAKPLVIDADGLNILAENLEAIQGRPDVTVLTPHPGEFARLDGSAPSRDKKARIEAASRLARKTGSLVVLKGKGTVVSEGNASLVIKTGNPGMATAGSGDVLTGMIAAFLAQPLPPFEAVALAAHIHGLAGDLAASKLGETSLTAADLLDFLPAAILRHQGKGVR